MIVHKNGVYSIEIDGATGRVGRFAFADDGPGTSVSARIEGSAFARPFIGTESEVPLGRVPGTGPEVEPKLRFDSASGATSLAFFLGAEALAIDAVLPERSGPRTGLRMDFQFLDLDPGSPRAAALAPHVLYTDEGFAFAYFVFRRMDGRFVWLTLDSPFAAWRFRYSRSGHRMLGMEILSRADDVVSGTGLRLSPVTCLSLAVGFSSGLDTALASVAERLGIAIPIYPVGGGIEGAEVPLSFAGFPAEASIVDPEGVESPIGADPALARLGRPGLHRIRTRGPGGRLHVGSLFCVESWRELFTRVSDFHAVHFQLESGAYARVIHRDSLLPDGTTFEGVEFGNDGAMMSCRTGEFGGFVAWAMIKGMELWGRNGDWDSSVRRYLGDWALNLGQPGLPHIGTVSREPTEFLGLGFSPCHLYRELNYTQHEIFLIEELCDYHLLSGERMWLDWAMRLGSHFATDHVGADGAALCRNSLREKAVDYTTVHTPMVAFLRLSSCLAASDPAESARFIRLAERMADHVAERGSDFPTEGEPCTEDGSMACAIVTLLRAWLDIAPKPAYLETALEIQALHESLRLRGSDARMFGSSLRFWETQYEGDDWGPSINAGHAWTMWSVEADFLLARATGAFRYLADAFAGTLCVASRVRESGAMPSCYTPDMIPGLPHHPYFLLFDESRAGDGAFWEAKAEGLLDDRRMTTSVFAMGYPPNTYSASGNYLLIKSAEIWDHCAGFDRERSVVVNGRFEGDEFVPAAPRFSRLFVGGIGPDVVSFRVPADAVVEVLFDPAVGLDGIEFEGALVEGKRPHGFAIRGVAPVVRIGSRTPS